MLKIVAPALLAALVLGAESCQAVPGRDAAQDAVSDRNAQAAGKCPGLKAPMPDSLAAKADARMKNVVAALQENRKSADALIAAAREAGAAPEAIADMERMSRAFRQFFMTAVSPQRIVEGFLAQPAGPEGGAGLVITAPDGSTWLVRPQMTPPAPPRKGAMPPKFEPRPGPCPQSGMPPRPGPRPCGPRPGPMPGQPGIQLPPADVLRDPALRQPAPQPDLAIIEENGKGTPYWPARQQLGKDGALQDQEKGAQAAEK